MRAHKFAAALTFLKSREQDGLEGKHNPLGHSCQPGAY